MKHLNKFNESKQDKKYFDIAKSYGLHLEDKVKETNLNPNVSVSIPTYFVISVTDYHEFEYHHDTLKLIGLKYKYQEIGYNSGRGYQALFYLGKKPSDLIEALEYLNSTEY